MEMKRCWKGESLSFNDSAANYSCIINHNLNDMSVGIFACKQVNGNWHFEGNASDFATFFDFSTLCCSKNCHKMSINERIPSCEHEAGVFVAFSCSIFKFLCNFAVKLLKLLFIIIIIFFSKISLGCLLFYCVISANRK